MRKESKLVYGIGLNDADYQVTVYAVISGKKKRFWTCPFYLTWSNMLMRCYSKNYQEKYPTYLGCSVNPKWHRFSAFREWMVSQGWQGCELDKDILGVGDKVYCPDNCVFVSGALNSFLTDSGATRGDSPTGVSWHKRDGKFRASCNNPFTGKREHLGNYDCPDEAHEAWRKRKHELACIYADQQNDPRIAEALRKRYIAEVAR